jgi:hypothetical protein
LRRLGVPAVVLVTERFIPLAESIIRVRGADTASMVLLPRSEETEYGGPALIESIAREALEDVVKRWLA